MGEGTTKLPPGFRFFPSDEELVVHFLYRKAARLPCQPDVVPTLDIRCCDPWDLNGKALQGGNQWYFFSHRTQNRATPNGYWNPVGADETIDSSGSDVGLKKTLIFYVGEPPQGIKTNWVMHEYHLLDGLLSNPSTSTAGSSRRSSSKRRSCTRVESSKWVICRVHESNYVSQASCFHDDGMELSCLDEVFLSLDDLDEVSLPD